MYDVMIIGSGVSGSAAARELSRYKAKICVLEKEEDVCCGTSKANSGIVHAGYDAKEGSLMAKLNVRGNAMMEQLSKDLDFPFKRIGSLVICLREEDMDKLQALYDRGVANGVSGLQILNREEVLEMEPNIADNVYAALYAPTAGIVCPFGLNIAMAENACENGVEFKFDTEVKELKKAEDIWEVHTNQGVFKTKYVVNAAGVYADKFHNMVSEKKIHITPRRGDYCLLDKTAGGHVKRTIFALPNEFARTLVIVLVVLMPFAGMIPMPTIAAILFIVAYNMCQWRTFIHLIRTAPKSDIIVLFATFILTILFDLVVAIEIGMVLACLLFIKRMSEETHIDGWTYVDDDTPDVDAHLKKLPLQIRVYEITGPLFFGAADAIEHIVVKDFTTCLVLRMRSVPAIDSTAMNALFNLTKVCENKGLTLVFSHVNEHPMNVMEKAGFVELVGRENFCPNISAALAHAEEISI